MKAVSTFFQENGIRHVRGVEWEEADNKQHKREGEEQGRGLVVERG